MMASDADPSVDLPDAAVAAAAPGAARHVIFSHGKESGPWGRKISSLAEVARGARWEIHSIDYRGIDQPRTRVAKLVDYCRGLAGERVLVGSSLGGYVVAAAARRVRARAVFLLAPALYLPELPELSAGAPGCPATVVHGWRDAVVPFEHSVRFARGCGATLHLLDGVHDLHDQIGVLRRLFESFLLALDPAALACD